MFPFKRGVTSLLQAEICTLNEGTITKAILKTVENHNITNIRECFESYCYTKEKCAVCEEAYEDIVEGENGIIDLNYKNVTFCCKRCLLNGWVDVVNYLRNNSIYICMYPCCCFPIHKDFMMHSTYEFQMMLSYVKNDLHGTGEKCFDPICSRLGYDQTEALDLEESTMETSIMGEFLRPKHYCSRKHAVSTKVLHVTNAKTLKNSPSSVEVYVNCDAPLASSCNELHNTYNYNPIFFDEKWFHTLFHCVAYLMYQKRKEELAEDIRDTMSITKVRDMIAANPLDTDEEEDFTRDLDTKIQELLLSKFVGTSRMYIIALYYSKSTITYVNCIPGLSNPAALNTLVADGITKFAKELYDIVFP